MSPLHVEIKTTDTMTEAQWGLWRDMLAANPLLNSPYFRPEFTQIAGRVCPGAAVAVLSRDGRTVGFFPHQRRGGTIQPLAAPMNDYHGVIAMPGDVPSLAEVAEVLPVSKLNVTAWVRQSDADGPGEQRRTVQAELGSAGFDAWYAERRATFGKFFKDKERCRRSMQTEFGPLRVETRLRDPQMLDWLIDLKRDQYRRTGRHDIFACGWTADLLHALLKADTPDFSASMAGLWAGDRLAAVEYSLLAGDQCHFWFPGYVPELSRCSPGILLSLDTMRMASETGVRSFDFGFAGEHYKKYFCNGERWVRDAVVVKPGLGATVSQAAVSALNLAGQGRGEQLRNSVRRRWAAIEACEVTRGNRLKGGLQAAGAALAKLSAKTSQRVSA